MYFLHDLLALLFPRICPACGNSLFRHETCICRLCEYGLPKTGFHEDPDNPVASLFAGRVRLSSATAFLYFNRGNRVQRLIHALKYKGRKDVGVFLGERYGHVLKHAPLFFTADLLVPVPLHPKRYMQRGYNQSEEFAVGLGRAMEVPVDRHLLERAKATETQTRKSRFERYRNVHDIFRVRDPELRKGMHILLVDDVVTTGATLESCILALQTIPGVKVSVVCIATALL